MPPFEDDVSNDLGGDLLLGLAMFRRHAGLRQFYISDSQEAVVWGLGCARQADEPQSSNRDSGLCMRNLWLEINRCSPHGDGY